MNVYRRLKELLNAGQKRKVIGLIIMIFFGALLETLGESIIVPLVSAVVSPDKIMGSEAAQKALRLVGMGGMDSDAFVRILLISVIVIYVVKTVYMLVLAYIQAGFITTTEADTSIRLLGEYLNRPYEYYLSADVNVMFQTINKDIPHVFELLQEVMRLITEILVSICLCVFLLIVDFKMTLSIAALLVILVCFVVLFLKPLLGNLGQERVKQQVSTMKWMQQGIFGIKDVKVADREGYFLEVFSKAYRSLAGVTRKYTVLNNAPRLVIEMLCIVGMMGYMLLVVLRGEDMASMLTPLSAFAMAAVRLMPSVNRISTHLSTIAYYEPSLNYICDNLNVSKLKDSEVPTTAGEKKKASDQPMTLTKEIRLKGIEYHYPGTEKEIFQGAEMVIPAGASVGIVGTSGAGKTTIVDILLGLLSPQKGQVTCDGRDIKDDYAGWLHNLGYIAQNIYMLDTTIRENVAFGVLAEDVNEDRIWEVLREAQMEEYVHSLPEGLDTVIGDRGVRISGGQRQRIGIARALYSDPELLVFDEATSALDNDTEAAIMDAINSLKGRKTMIIIAHRLKTIENCDMIYRVEGGKIERTTVEA